MTQIKNNFIESIGNTPLIKLKAASEITGCNIYGKAEYLNPGGSVKDRAALALIKDAQEKKLISEGGIVVEGTAGNTGIGLCLLGNSLGYKTIKSKNTHIWNELAGFLRMNKGLGTFTFCVFPENTNFGIKSSVVESLIQTHNVKNPSPYTKEMSIDDLGYNIKQATLYLSCWMTLAQIKKFSTKKVIFRDLVN